MKDRDSSFFIYCQEERTLLFSGMTLFLMSAVFLVFAVLGGFGRPGHASQGGCGLSDPLSSPSTACVELGKLTFATASGRHDFAVEVARRSHDLERGLMFRHELAADRGMLFVFPRKDFISMWMKNTFIPLDMIFLDGRKVVSVVENTSPFSEKLIVSLAPADRVVELNAGVAARIGLRQGDAVELAPFP